jgi:hypothetical protein
MWDLSEVVLDKGFELLPAGDYLVSCESAELKSTKDGSGEFLNAKFSVVSGEFVNRKVFQMFNLVNKNTQAVEIGRKQLKGFLVAAGATSFQLTSADALCGMKAIAVVKIKTDAQYGDKNIISYFKTAPASDKVDPLSVPF